MALVAVTLFGVPQAKEYTTNAICQQSNCINPIFPGMEDLRRLEATQLQCQHASDAKQHMQFCKKAVNYDTALSSPNSSGNITTLKSVVLQQDNAASTMYYYHLAGMNVEAWEHRHPEESGDECVQAVWKMVCHTYFPRAEAGCKQGEPTKHLRPCKNVCGSFIKACNVECCDESVQCIFSKKVALVDGSEITDSGYHDELGPSAACTGASSRKSHPSLAVLTLLSLALTQLFLPARSSAKSAGANGSSRLKKYAACVLLFVVCTMLQGCTLGQLFSHPTPTWEQMPSYWQRFQFIPEGAPASEKVYNSCDLILPAREQCSGHGECETWRPDLKSTAAGKDTKFCKCYRDWADPECRTKRKSQMTAFFFSVFLGFFGADQFYLDHYITGCAKLATLSGVLAAWWLHGWWVLNLLSYACAMWWVFDIVNIGSAPIYAAEYRLAYDLPHWFYVTFTIMLFAVLGYVFFGVMQRADRFRKAQQKFMMQEDAGQRLMVQETEKSLYADRIGQPTLRSYGVPQGPPVDHHHYGTTPDHLASTMHVLNHTGVIKGNGEPQYNRYSAYGIMQHAMRGFTNPNRYDHRLQPNSPAYETARTDQQFMWPTDYGNGQNPGQHFGY